MTLTNASPRAVVQQMLAGSTATTLLYIAAELGLADLLDSGPRSSRDLALLTGANQNALHRVLRGLSVIGIVHPVEILNLNQNEVGFALTPLGETLRRNAPESMRKHARLVSHPVIQQAWSGLYHTVMTGQPAFDHVFGMDMASYFVQRPSLAELFNDFMGGVTAEVAPTVVAAYDFDGIRCIVDVGGGDGSLLRAILRANPDVRGIVVDLPHVRAQAIQAIAADRLAERCRFVTADFFHDSLPAADMYLLKSVLHDWDDERCVAILEACRRAMDPSARVLVVESPFVDDGADASAEVIMSDLTMLAMDTGRERTIDEHRALLEAAGFRLERVVPTHGGPSILEAMPTM
jgi:orsellinic acid C2-O-methyltransferase